MTTSSPIRALCVAALMLLVVLAGQALGASSAPVAGRTAGEVIGRTGFAYLGGLRTFAAAVIWNRIDPQYHEYFEGVSLKDQTFMVPKMRMVTVLDPSFTEAYYITSYIVFQRVGHAQGIEVAREGIEKNPHSGQLSANLAQLLFLDDKGGNRSEVFGLLRDTIADDAQWHNEDENYEGYAVAMTIFRSYGEMDVANAIETLLESWNAQGIATGDHDHDGDGKQDH